MVIFFLYFPFAYFYIIYIHVRNAKAYNFFLPAFISVFHNTFLSAFHVPFGREMTQGIVLITSPSHLVIFPSQPMQKPIATTWIIIYFFSYSQCGAVSDYLLKLIPNCLISTEPNGTEPNPLTRHHSAGHLWLLEDGHLWARYFQRWTLWF